MNDPASDRTATAASDVMVPVLRTEEGPPDAVAIAAWHLALSNLLGVDIPHDLLGLWLFPVHGGVLLLAPAELAQDRLAPGAPAPFLHQQDLHALEGRVRDAGYQSVVAVPVRGAHRDHGLALFAALGPATYGIERAIRLHGVAHALVPTFEALAASPPLASVAAGDPADDPAGLVVALAQAAAEARSGADLLRLLSGVLHPALPHERIEVAVPGALPGRWALLSGPPEGHRWGDPGDGVHGAVDALLARRQEDGTIQVPDLREAGLAWPSYAASRAVQRVRSVIGVELRVAGGPLAWLLVGGTRPGAFRPDDRDLLQRVAPIVGLRAQGLRQALAAEVGQAQVQSLQASQPRVGRLVALLAGTQHWGEASRHFARETCQALGYEAARFVLRIGEDRAVTMRPGTLHPLVDLPSEPLDLSPFAGVIEGTVPFVVYGERGADLAVPLRIGGRPVGALELLGGVPGSTGHPVTAAQQFADVIAPHLELLRRNALDRPLPRLPKFPAGARPGGDPR